MPPTRRDQRVIIHFDYDCFYASVFEKENPSLKSMPLAVQQKQIIVTCNYEARRRGLHKLQLISEAKKIVPDVVIVLGEELGRFRDASKLLYKYLEAFTWSGKVEKLGFDEVWMDVTDLVSYNQALLNQNDLSNSFFQLKQNDPTLGFSYDATKIAGHTFPTTRQDEGPDYPLNAAFEAADELLVRLKLGSHLARHIRLSLEEHLGYTSTVGISTNKILSKLVGNLNKPKGQTTLLPPYVSPTEESSPATNSNNVFLFLDGHDIGKIPGIGFKMSQRIRNHVLSRPAEFDNGLIYGGTKESIMSGDVRLFPSMGPELLEKILGGPGSERGIGGRAWNLINGVDDIEVQRAKKVPTQISIEDSYIKLDTMSQVLKEFRILASSLVQRMHTDLLEDDNDDSPSSESQKRWVAHPKTLRLSTRPRPPPNPDGTRTRSFGRISRSGPLPNFVFNLKEAIDATVEKLVHVALVPMFRRLHPQQGGWNLSLINLAVTNMVETASEGGTGGGRDIGRMFKRQEEVLKEWKVEDRDVPPDIIFEPDDHDMLVDSGREVEPSAGDEISKKAWDSAATAVATGSEDLLYPTQNTTSDMWDDSDDDNDENNEMCTICQANMPAFAMAAHHRYHDLDE